jgi:hypothetical protein
LFIAKRLPVIEDKGLGGYQGGHGDYLEKKGLQYSGPLTDTSIGTLNPPIPPQHPYQLFIWNDCPSVTFSFGFGRARNEATPPMPGNLLPVLLWTHENEKTALLAPPLLWV